MDDLVVLIGPKGLIEQLAADPRINSTLLGEPRGETGGPLANKKLDVLFALSVATATLVATDKAITVAEHIHHWMNQTGIPSCEVFVQPGSNIPVLMKCYKNMTASDIGELLEEAVGYEA